MNGVRAIHRIAKLLRTASTKAAQMTEISALAFQLSSMRSITYGYGQSVPGGFVVAIDDKGVCAVLLGDDSAALLRDLQAAFPDRTLEAGSLNGACGSVVSAVASLIERPATHPPFPLSIRGGDFEQMVYAALRQTKPGATVTPAEVAVMIGAAVGSETNVRAYAFEDLLAVVVPFHRLQERDGTSPAYRWGEDCRQALLQREATARSAYSVGLFWPKAVITNQPSEMRREEAAAQESDGLLALYGAEQPQLSEGGDSIIETDFLDDLAILDLEDGGAGEVHLPARVGGRAANQEVLERGAGMGAAALPLPDDIIAFSDEISRAPEVEVRKGRAEIRHESLDVRTSLPRLVQRVFEQHIRRGDFIDDAEIAGLAPEVGEPAADDRLVVVLQAHKNAFQLLR
jgi:AraC family transcriptional regulator of adaptative response/methylated-DNA-[protein]-cysteine methyltransferase